MRNDILVVGAGISGLSFARQLDSDPSTILIIDKARGVGGRCATRTVEGHRVDFGVPVLHGSSPAFLAALGALPVHGRRVDWPVHVRGFGTPCQPKAYRSGESRMAFENGVSEFPKHLAAGLHVELETKVGRLSLEGDTHFAAHTSSRVLESSTMILTCAAEQSAALLEPLAEQFTDVRSVLWTLRQAMSVPCLTVIAGYDRPTATDWHLLVPGPGGVIHSLINDSSKRKDDTRQVLVIQGTTQFSAEHLEDEPDSWALALLQDATTSLGAWAAKPVWKQTHRWRFARIQRGHELSRPVLLRWPGGATLGLCGDAFHPAGGVEGAWLSGRALADRVRANGATLVNPPKG